jgi:ATP-binding cassette subfamily G (WHITE) protein 1
MRMQTDRVSSSGNTYSMPIVPACTMDSSNLLEPSSHRPLNAANLNEANTNENLDHQHRQDNRNKTNDPLGNLEHMLANIEVSKMPAANDSNTNGHMSARLPSTTTTTTGHVIELHELPVAAEPPNDRRHTNSRSPSSVGAATRQESRRVPSSSSLAASSLSSSTPPPPVSSCSSSTSLAEEEKLGATGRPDRRRSHAVRSLKQHESSTGFEVAWLNFTYSVEPNILEDPRWGMVNKLFHKERRMILKGLSGGFKSGQMVALMGPSGAGKTCLLESISGVRTTGIGGRMCLRGRKRAQLVIVPQYDNFMPQFSVEETIVYGSRMKNPAGTNHRQVADTVIEQLGLQACRHNNIQRCSGGQRKRAAIAQELVSRPNILILDEPTSGLDSSCCYHTVKVLRDVLDQSVKTDEPMAIVSTIHQPSAKVFKMFDLIYLLGKTGHVAYSGPPDELLPTISDVTRLECPKYSNPSDFMIELVAYDYGDEPVERLIEFERQKAAQYVKDFEKRAGLSQPDSGQAATVDNGASTTQATLSGRGRKGSKNGLANGSSRALSALSVGPRLVPSKSDTHLANSKRLDQIQQRLRTNDLLTGMTHVIYKNNVTLPLRKATSNDNRRHPFLWHTWVHLHRSFLQAIRDPILNNMRILIHLGFATLLVLLYGKKSGEARGCPPVLGLPQEITNPNNESMIDLADNVGYIFMCIMMITYVSLMSTVLTFPIDIKTVGKEYKNGWYGTISYFVGKTFADLPFIVLYPVVYCLITWHMTNQADDQYWRFFSFTGLIIMNAMNSQSFGLILGALFVNSVTAATFLGPVITIPWYLFTGFTKRAHRLAEPFKSVSKFLFTRHIFEGILDTVYGHKRCNCSEFLRQYHEIRFEEASRLGQLVSIETLSSLDYYDGLETVASVDNETLLAPKSGGSNWLERTFDAATTVFADGDELDLSSLMDTNVKASSTFSFGLDFEPTCPSDYETFVIQDFRLRDRSVERTFFIVLSMLCAIRTMTFALIAWKIRTRQL